MTKLSIGIPVYNVEKYLSRCIESILNKSSYENYEIIVVENNSTSKEIFDYYESISKHPQVKVVTFEGAFNYSKINNFGVQNSDGELILLLNKSCLFCAFDKAS